MSPVGHGRSHRTDDHFPREVFFFGFGLPEVAAFSVPAFLPFAAIVFPPFEAVGDVEQDAPLYGRR